MADDTRGSGQHRREAARIARRDAPLKPTYALDLPVLAHAETICEAVQSHPVVVICGETGSGKSTQLPKLMLELGRGVDGMIGHTQPRRIAARSLACGIYPEVGTEARAVPNDCCSDPTG